MEQDSSKQPNGFCHLLLEMHILTTILGCLSTNTSHCLACSPAARSTIICAREPSALKYSSCGKSLDHGFFIPMTVANANTGFRGLLELVWSITKATRNGKKHIRFWFPRFLHSVPSGESLGHFCGDADHYRFLMICQSEIIHSDFTLINMYWCLI